jgi:N-carbamoylputrescine amidase
MRDIRVAAAVCRCPPGNLKRNLATMQRLCRRAAARDVQLICFPELNLTGYALGDELRQTPLAKSDPVIGRVGQMARDHHLVILAGLAVLAPDGRIYAEHRVFPPEGESAAYRKLHAAPPEEGVLSPGAGIPMFDADGVHFGIQLCYDAHFPELTTCMALDGAEVLFVPHASPRLTPRAKLASWLRHLPARAFDNALFVVACNQTGIGGSGLTFPGLALVLGPDGRVLTKRVSMAEGLLVADLKAEYLDAVRRHRMRYFLPRRRPYLYRTVCRS